MDFNIFKNLMKRVLWSHFSYQSHDFNWNILILLNRAYFVLTEYNFVYFER